MHAPSSWTHLPPNDSYPQHVVTAVIVAHDGAAWLPRVLEALLEQTRPVQRVVAVDTGSRDRSGSVLAGQLGPSVVFGMERGTGYGAAIRRALQHRAANMNVPAPGPQAAGDRVEWVWLLHDDSEPAPDALEQLLRGAAETRSAAVLGPKVKDWSDRQVIREAGITIDTAGRRITGVEPREVDQGQHDGDRDSLAVGSPGMLVRRDVWDLTGGFDPGMGLFRDDVDFCWRVHEAGYRVRVITDAVVYHAEASAKRRRPVSVARRPSQLDRRNAMLTLAGNLPLGPMLAAMADNLAVSVLRCLFFLFAKRVTAALDELAAVVAVVGHPLRLLAVRRRRARGRRAAYSRLRRDLPPGHSVRRMAELVASLRSGSAPGDETGAHASDDPEDADFLASDTGLAQRILTNPGVLLFLGLTVLALVAERSLLGTGPLGGGALVPAWGGASGLWNTYLQGFHPVGVGSGSSAPPYLAVIAALATVLGGKPWLAIDVILLGCVPLAGLSAFHAARRVTQSVPVRLWAAASYALLPVAMGAIAAGRIGTAVVFVLAPALALLAGRMLTLPRRQARRAAWAAGLAVAVAAAFVPLVWVVALIAAVALVVARPARWRNLGIVVAVPPLLLLPWTVQIAASPSALLLEAGLQQPDLAVHDLPAKSLMLLSPGGPGLPPFWVTGGIIFAALAALLISRRRALMMAGWGVALSGLLISVAVSRAVITPVGGGAAVSAWPGVALLIPAVGLLLAGATAGDALMRRRTGGPPGRVQTGAGARLGALVLAVIACSAPALAAGSWVAKGVPGPVAPVPGPVVPPVVAASANSDLQLRTLVLRSSGGQVSYSLERGASPQFGDPDLAPASGAQSALDTAVAALVATNGGEAVNQAQLLAQLDIGFVLLPSPVNQNLARLLDGVAGLRPVSATSAFDLWRLADPVARVRVVEPGGASAAIGSGAVGVSGARAPAAGGTLELAEPAGGWNATLNGAPLTPVPSPAGSWAQAFRLPAGGGVLNISHPQTARDIILVLELLAVLAVAALALPGTRTAEEEEAVGGQAVAATQAATSVQDPAGRAGLAAAAAAAQAGRRARGRAAPGPGRTRGRPYVPRRDTAAGPGFDENATQVHRPEPEPVPGRAAELDEASGPRRDWDSGERDWDTQGVRHHRAPAYGGGGEPVGDWPTTAAAAPGAMGPAAEWHTAAAGPPRGTGPEREWPTGAAGPPRGAGPEREWPTGAAGPPRGAGPERDWPTGAAAAPGGRRPPGGWPTPDAAPPGGSGRRRGFRGAGSRPHSDDTGGMPGPVSDRPRGQPPRRLPADQAPPWSSGQRGGPPPRSSGQRGEPPWSSPQRGGRPPQPPSGQGGGPPPQPSGQRRGRPPAPGQRGGWPQQPPGWPSEMLAPLPPADPGRHGRRDEPDDDDESSGRWSSPDYDAGADQW
jgi:GT2 family glycosyltransferase